MKDNQERLRDNIQRLFAPEQPKSGFSKIKTDFETAKQVSYGHTCTCGASAGVAGLKFAPFKPAKY